MGVGHAAARTYWYSQPGVAGMFMHRRKVALLASLVAVTAAWAERAPQAPEDAELVVIATVKKISATKSTFGPDGVMTSYRADVKVNDVVKGDGAKAGDTPESPLV